MITTMHFTVTFNASPFYALAIPIARDMTVADAVAMAWRFCPAREAQGTVNQHMPIEATAFDSHGIFSYTFSREGEGDDPLDWRML